MADLEAGKLTVVNFKLISQMVSNSGVAGKSPGYIGNIKKKKKNLTSVFLWDVRCLISVIVCLYICWYVFVHMSVGVLCVSSQYGIKINKEKK